MLQKLWTLRPEFREKPAFTIAAGIGALIREVERADQQATIAVSSAASQSERAASETSDESTTEADEPAEVLDPLLEAKKAQVAADMMWG